MSSYETLSLSAHGRSYRMQWPVDGDGDQATGRIAARVRSGQPYEKTLLEHIYEQRFSGLAVDVGAHVGNHALWMAVVCGLDVVAFEPIEHVRLQHNVKLNGLGDRVRVEPVALGAVRGTAAPVGADRLDLRASRWRLRRRVKVRTLDSYRLRNVALVKIDVEGMEPDVLRGAEGTIVRERPVIFAEEAGLAEHEAIACVLRQWGYSPGVQFRGSPNATPVRRWDPPHVIDVARGDGHSADASAG